MTAFNVYYSSAQFIKHLVIELHYDIFDYLIQYI